MGLTTDKEHKLSKVQNETSKRVTTFMIKREDVERKIIVKKVITIEEVEDLNSDRTGMIYTGRRYWCFS